MNDCVVNSGYSAFIAAKKKKKKSQDWWWLSPQEEWSTPISLFGRISFHLTLLDIYSWFGLYNFWQDYQESMLYSSWN